MLAKLLEGLVEEGLGVQSMEVLSSQRADHLSVQGQVPPFPLTSASTPSEASCSR